MNSDSAEVVYMRQAQTLDYLHGCSLGREQNMEGQVPVRCMSTFTVEGINFDRVFVVQSNPNDSAFDVCCRLHR